jgi:hypothetical protein
MEWNGIRDWWRCKLKFSKSTNGGHTWGHVALRPRGAGPSQDLTRSDQTFNRSKRMVTNNTPPPSTSPWCQALSLDLYKMERIRHKQHAFVPLRKPSMCVLRWSSVVETPKGGCVYIYIYIYIYI